ncbi:Protein F37C4.5 [Leucoagaricus sp. SymC.cos]|nr:Protein F37C4.5 [Leucoagaricus sp. SymC.cos]
MTTETSPPRELELNAGIDGRITAVTLFSYQADVTRTFNIPLEVGATRVKVPTGFPASFDETRLRIHVPEGITLADVKTVLAKSDNGPDYDKIDALYDKKLLLEKSLERCKRMVTALEGYAATALSKESGMSPTDIGHFMNSYEEAGSKWDERVQKLEKEIQEIQDKLDEDEMSDGPSDSSDSPKHSRTGVAFSLSTDVAKSVDVDITYGVSTAYWSAVYDIYATSDNDQAVSIVYKASISNNSGESWDDVGLKLGLVAPQSTPRLQPWKVSFQKAPNSEPNAWATYPLPKILADAEIDVPEKVQVPNKTQGHVLVLGRYTLASQLLRICTPKLSSSVSIKAKVTNTCKYPLRGGSSSIYLDGNFVSSFHVYSANPGDTFEIPLGIDPNIHVTYHPYAKDVAAVESISPFSFRPVLTYSCSQRITVVNTRDIHVHSLTIIDSIPTADDIDLFIKLVNPPLKYPEALASGFKDLVQAKTGIQITEGVPESCSVFARWDIVDEPPYDLSLLGANGKINWVCSIRERGSVDLNLQWQVLSYSSKQIKDF